MAVWVIVCELHSIHYNIHLEATLEGVESRRNSTPVLMISAQAVQVSVIGISCP